MHLLHAIAPTAYTLALPRSSWIWQQVSWSLRSPFRSLQTWSGFLFRALYADAILRKNRYTIRPNGQRLHV
jgi:hypothetical protein